MAATIALCMVVRDEAAVIERCLLSVRDLIDAWAVCDTGSRDGTPELVERCLDGIPGRLHREEWRDFGWNRTRLMEAARGAADYLLLLDADMTLEQLAPLPPLEADAYLLRHSGDPSYRVPRLVRGDRHWWFEHSTHEYLATDGQYTQAILDELLVHHHGDGSARAEKFRRDRRLLQAELERAPDDPRATFYLAQTLADLGEVTEAIRLYERRVALGGWDEERFYAAYRAGALLAGSGDDRAAAALLAAWELRPTRAEPLYELARLCRLRGWRRSGHHFASLGAGLQLPDDALFVHRWIYAWGMRFELAMACYWIGERDLALQIADQLLVEECLPTAFETAARDLRHHCGATGSGRARTVPLLADACPSFRVAEVELDVDPAWPAFNPSVAVDDDGGFRMIVRTANYLRERDRYVMLDAGDTAIRTLNYLVRLDDELTVVDVAPLQEDAAEAPARFPSRVVGYEDCRLFRAQGRWWATATVRDRNPQERCQIALLELDEARIVGVRLLVAPYGLRHEKNWMPFGEDGRLRLVYRAAPTVVLECDPGTGRCTELVRHASPDLGELRGGSQGTPLSEGHLFVVHEPDYSHRLILIDREHRLAARSRRFGFVTPGVEFCAGLAPFGDHLLLSFGIGDRRAMLGVMEMEEALGLLEPVPSGRV